MPFAAMIVELMVARSDHPKAVGGLDQAVPELRRTTYIHI